MDGKQDMEVVNVAIQKLIEDEKSEKKRTRQASIDADGDLFGDADDGNEDQLLLSKLLSQVETSKASGGINQNQVPPVPELIPKTKEMSSDVIPAADNSNNSENIHETTESTTEEIMKELKEVKRQNTITHRLLSAMIVLTVTWQLSEVSMMLKVKNGVSRPFQSLGNALTRMLKRGKKGKDNLEESLEHLSESMPALKIPELSKIDMQALSDTSSRTLE